MFNCKLIMSYHFLSHWSNFSIIIWHNMKLVKDRIDQQRLKGVYKINCSCGRSYIGVTRRLFKIRIKEHQADTKNQRTRSFTLVEHSLRSRHHICLEDTKIISREDQYFKRKFREGLQIMKHPDNLNQDGGGEVSRSWLPLIPHL